MKNEEDYKDSAHLHRLLMKPENEPARRAYSKMYRALMKCSSALDRIRMRNVSGSLQEEVDEMRRIAYDAFREAFPENES
jgi:hypothetical protein